MNKIIEHNSMLKNRILNILDKALNYQSSFLKYMIEDSEKETIEMKAQILSYIKKGIEM